MAVAVAVVVLAVVVVVVVYSGTKGLSLVVQLNR